MSNPPSDLFLRDETGPLRVLITRPEDQAAETAELVQAAGGTALVHPCLRLAAPEDLRPLQEALHDLTRFTWVALASANATRAVAAALRGSTTLPLLAAVGPRTAVSLQELGLPVALMASAATAEGLAAALLTAMRERGRAPHTERVLLPRAAQGREALADALVAAGVQVTSVPAYQMLPPTTDELRALVTLIHTGAVDLIPLGSPRTVEIVLAALGIDAKNLLRHFAIGALGPTTAAALQSHGVRVDVSAGAASSFAELLRALAVVHRQRQHPVP